MAGKGGRGVGATMKQIALWLLGLGFLLALLRLFNMDPFGIVNWVIGTAWNIIDRIADLLQANASFREIFSKPQG